MSQIKKSNKFLLEENQYMELSTAEVIAYNPTTQVELFSNSLKSDKLEQKIDEVKIKAGVNNNTFAVIDKNKEITFEMTDVLARYDWSLNKWGSELQSGKVKATHFPKAYSVTLSGSNKIIKLSKTPLYPEEVSIYHTDTQRLLIKDVDFTITDNIVTITDPSIADGDSMWITSFSYTSETLSYYDITGSSLPSVVSLVVRKPVYNLNGEIVYFKVMIFPKVKMSQSITEEGATEKDEKTRTTTFTVMQSQDYPYLSRVYLEPYREDTFEEITPVSDLSGVGGSLKANLTWTAIGNNATNVTLKYKKTSASSYATINTTTTTGVYAVAPLNENSTSVEVLGLEAGKYNFKLAYIIDGELYESNEDTETVTA